MIQAVLQGKSRGCELSEDLLTSTVFGRLKYIQPHKVLIPFLERAVTNEEHSSDYASKLKEKGINLRDYQEIEFVYWPVHEREGEPDLVLLFSKSVKKQEDYLLLIEVKYKSGKSGEGEMDQLARYARAITNGIRGFSSESIASFQGIKGDIIYLTESEAKLDIERSKQEISSFGDVEPVTIFHLQWRTLYETLEEQFVFYTHLESKILEDLKNYLEKLGLRGFFGFSGCEQSLYEVFLEPLPVFYQSSRLIESVSFFQKLPDVSFADLSMDSRIFYKE